MRTKRLVTWQRLTLCISLAGTVGGAGPVLGADWEWLNPLPQGASLGRIWGGGSELFVVAGGGAVLRFDGESWSRESTGSVGGLEAIWGFDNTDPESVFVATSQGEVYERRPDGWSRIETGSNAPIYGIWGTSRNDLYAVGWSGTILHYDGSAWTPMASGTSDLLIDVQGFDANEVFAVGVEGTVVRYDGSKWQDVSPPTEMRVDIYDAWATAESLFVAGGIESTTVLRYDGEAWTVSLHEAQGAPMSSIWGSGPDDVYAVDGFNRIHHFDGQSWSTTASGSTKAISAIGGTRNGILVTAGEAGEILRKYGEEWRPIVEGERDRLRGAWSAATGEIFVVGDRGTILTSENGVRWVRMASGVDVTLYAAWGSSAQDVYAVGVGPTILHFDGDAWAPVTVGDSPYEGYYAVWGSGPDDVIAVGSQGLALHFDGTQWLGRAGGPHYVGLLGVWGSGPNDVWAVGSGGWISRFDGTTWWPYSPPTLGAFWGVWGTGANDVYAAGGSGVYRWDGQTWSRWNDAPSDLWAIGAASAGEIFVERGDGIYRYDGCSWQLAEQVGIGVDGFARRGTGGVLAVGSNGAILLNRHIFTSDFESQDTCGWIVPATGAPPVVEQ